MHKYIFETVDLNELINNISEKVTANILKAVENQPLLNRHSEEKLSRKQTADYLNVTLPTLDSYRRDGRIPFHQTARTIYFLRSEIDEALLVRLSFKRGHKHTRASADV